MAAARHFYGANVKLLAAINPQDGSLAAGVKNPFRGTDTSQDAISRLQRRVYPFTELRITMLIW
jgi:hypothetical protein